MRLWEIALWDRPSGRRRDDGSILHQRGPASPRLGQAPCVPWRHCQPSKAQLSTPAAAADATAQASRAARSTVRIISKSTVPAS